MAKPAIFCQKLAKDDGIQNLLRQKLLRLGVLIFQPLRTLGLENVLAAVVDLSIILRRFRDAVLARQISRIRTGLMLAQHANNLLFRKLARFICLSIRRRTLTST